MSTRKLTKRNLAEVEHKWILVRDVMVCPLVEAATFIATRLTGKYDQLSRRIWMATIT